MWENRSRNTELEQGVSRPNGAWERGSYLATPLLETAGVKESYSPDWIHTFIDFLQVARVYSQSRAQSHHAHISGWSLRETLEDPLGDWNSLSQTLRVRDCLILGKKRKFLGCKLRLLVIEDAGCRIETANGCASRSHTIHAEIHSAQASR